MNAVEALTSIRLQPGQDFHRKEDFEMCETNVYLMKDEKEELFMEGVDIIIPEKEGIYLQNIFGEKRLVKARIKEMKLVEHRILFVED